MLLLHWREGGGNQKTDMKQETVRIMDCVIAES